MTKEQWYNPKTNQLQSNPPWGNSWVHPDIITEQYSDWQQVSANFRLPELEKSSGQRLTELDAEYQPLFSELSQALGLATLAENADLIAELKDDYTVLKTEYQYRREEINNGN